MDVLRIIAENKIEIALKNGEFDNLPGKGRPLQLGQQNPEMDDQFLANHLLKNNGYIPDWLEERKVLLNEIEAFQKEPGLSNQSEEQFKETFIHLNRRICGYNLRVPVVSMQLQLLQYKK
jgi:DnaJ homolog subfamily C member 28